MSSRPLLRSSVSSRKSHPSSARTRSPSPPLDVFSDCQLTREKKERKKNEVYVIVIFFPHKTAMMVMMVWAMIGLTQTSSKLDLGEWFGFGLTSPDESHERSRCQIIGIQESTCNKLLETSQFSFHRFASFAGGKSALAVSMIFWGHSLANFSRHRQVHSGDEVVTASRLSRGPLRGRRNVVQVCVLWVVSHHAERLPAYQIISN